jgi:hypothetical protein
MGVRMGVRMVHSSRVMVALLSSSSSSRGLVAAVMGMVAPLSSSSSSRGLVAAVMGMVAPLSSSRALTVCYRSSWMIKWLP